MIIRVISGGTLKALEIDDISQIVVMAATGEPVACAQETSAGAIVATHAGEPDFHRTLTALGVTPAAVKIMD